MRSPALFVTLALATIFFGCGPGEPAPESPASRESSSARAEPESEERAAGVMPEQDGDGEPEPSVEEASQLQQPVGGLPTVQGPIPVGPGVTPPRRVEGSASIAGLRELFRLGNYALGACIFRLTISDTGKVVAVDFLKPVDIAPEVRSTIVEATEEWRFEPATKDGRPVAVFYFLSITHCPVDPREPQER